MTENNGVELFKAKAKVLYPEEDSNYTVWLELPNSKKGYNETILFQSGDTFLLKQPEGNLDDINLNMVRRYVIKVKTWHEITTTFGLTIALQFFGDEQFVQFYDRLKHVLKQVGKFLQEKTDSSPSKIPLAPDTYAIPTAPFLTASAPSTVFQAPDIPPSLVLAKQQCVTEKVSAFVPKQKANSRRPAYENVNLDKKVPASVLRKNVDLRRPAYENVNLDEKVPASMQIQNANPRRSECENVNVDLWVCSKCTTENRNSVPKCEVCDSPRHVVLVCVVPNEALTSGNSHLILPLPADGNIQPLGDNRMHPPRSNNRSNTPSGENLKHHEGVHEWMCKCTCRNGAGNYICSACHRIRTDVWQCPGCSKLYHLDLSNCSDCNVWRCGMCTSYNRPGSTKCAGCQRIK